jgi:hypothetical protein
MAIIVNNLAAIPNSDIRAMAVYLASFNDTAISSAAEATLAARLETIAGASDLSNSSAGARIRTGSRSLYQLGRRRPLIIANALKTKQCALVLAKVRQWPKTPNVR